MNSSSLFKLGPRCGWVVKVTPRPLSLWERLRAHCVRSWMCHRGGVDGAEYLASAKIRSSNRPATVATTTALSRPGCTQYCYVMHTFPSTSHCRTTPNKYSRPEDVGSAFLRSIRTNVLSKAT